MTNPLETSGDGWYLDDGGGLCRLTGEIVEHWLGGRLFLAEAHSFPWMPDPFDPGKALRVLDVDQWMGVPGVTR